MSKRARWAVAICAVLFAAAGCGGGGDNGGGGGGGTKAAAGFQVPKIPMQQKLRAGEGQLNIIAWAG